MADEAMNIAALTVDSAGAAARLADPTLESTFTAKQRFAVFVHDVIAHPLMWFTRDAKWVWRLHDWAGRTVLGSDGLTEALTVTGPGSLGVVALLKEHGHNIIRVWPDPNEVHSVYQSSGASFVPRREPPPLYLERRPQTSTIVETKDLVKGDVIAWQGSWHTIVGIKCEDTARRLDIGEVVIVAELDDKWRTKPD